MRPRKNLAKKLVGNRVGLLFAFMLILCLIPVVQAVGRLGSHQASKNRDASSGFLPVIVDLGDSYAATWTPEPIGTATATVPPLHTVTATAAAQPSPTATATDTFLPTATPTSSATPTITPSPTPTATRASCGTLTGILEGQTLLSTDCDYVVTGNVLVPEDATMNAQPGARILFDGPYYIKVDGVIVVDGTADKRVVFTSNLIPRRPGDWIGLHITGQEPSSVNYATIEFGGGISSNSGALRAENGGHVIDNSFFHSNLRTDVSLRDGDNMLRNSVIENGIDFGGSAIELSGSGYSQVLNNSIRGNRRTYILGVGKSDVPQRIEGNRFEDNVVTQSGLILATEYGDALVINNVFRGNTVGPSSFAGIIKISNAATIKCNLFQDNTISGDFGNPAGTIVLSSSKEAVVVDNSIYEGPSDYDVIVTYIREPQDVRGNYWGTVDSADISARIYDYYDDFNLVEVNYEPFLASPPNCAPSLE